MTLDIITGLVLIYGFYTGYSKGMIKALFGIASLLIALLAAMKLSPLTIYFLERNISLDPRWIVVLGFVLTFLVVIIGVRFAGRIIERSFQKLEINFVNKVAGGAISTGIFLIIFSSFVWFLDDVKLLPEKTKSDSITYPILEPLPSIIGQFTRHARPLFRQFWDKTGDAMDQVRERAQERQKSENQ